jgi:hypothetical protein
VQTSGIEFGIDSRPNPVRHEICALIFCTCALVRFGASYVS